MYLPFLNRFEPKKKLGHDDQADDGGHDGARRPENGSADQPQLHIEHRVSRRPQRNDAFCDGRAARN